MVGIRNFIRRLLMVTAFIIVAQLVHMTTNSSPAALILGAIAAGATWYSLEKVMPHAYTELQDAQWAEAQDEARARQARAQRYRDEEEYRKTAGRR